MSTPCRGLACALVILVCGLAALVAQKPPVLAPRLGTVSFPTSSTPAAREAFVTGVLYLHSFQYESAEKEFRRAEVLEPGFAMAYWGEAMTYNHGVWNEQDSVSARAALQRLAPTRDARRALAPTERERHYLEAIEQLYGAGSKPRRDTLYARVMEQLVRDEPLDLEAKAFYALALLGLNQGVRDTVTYLRAARYADTVFRANPTHPGAAHYLIHSFDDPIHASRGLEAARAYSHIAPDAAHAQHMTTHIFLAMGMWDEVVSQNRIAVGLTATVPGHYSSWLVYGLIQQGRYDAARDLIETLRKSLAGGGLRNGYTALVEMRSHYLLHSQDWRGSVFNHRVSYDKMTTLGNVLDVFTDGVIAYRRRDDSALSSAAVELARLVDALQVDLGPGDPGAMAGRVMARELGGMQLFLGGSRESAVRLLREAAAIEDAMPMEFGPPLIVDPSHEVLGDMLLEMDPSAAKLEFERALLLAPGRSRALIGLARAAVATGDKSTAVRAIGRVSLNWHAADPDTRLELTPLSAVVNRMP
jgi:tetratricopeptide (TPR) repeat protein